MTKLSAFSTFSGNVKIGRFLKERLKVAPESSIWRLSSWSCPLSTNLRFHTRARGTGTISSPPIVTILLLILGIGRIRNLESFVLLLLSPIKRIFMLLLSPLAVITASLQTPLASLINSISRVVCIVPLLKPPSIPIPTSLSPPSLLIPSIFMLSPLVLMVCLSLPFPPSPPSSFPSRFFLLTFPLPSFFPPFLSLEWWLYEILSPYLIVYTLPPPYSLSNSQVSKICKNHNPLSSASLLGILLPLFLLCLSSSPYLFPLFSPFFCLSCLSLRKRKSSSSPFLSLSLPLPLLPCFQGIIVKKRE